ncbi:hypothetical protein EYF80_022018 [Liparis tanakae]|uniref:Uncharacterized protein n=1 Tax=Liparis tanakae TaxID=230148 RepID=A0A4Z2HSB0_9TELE|nr:hypothetical protein EYF80_022018 [Liparis tanakae]
MLLGAVAPYGREEKQEKINASERPLIGFRLTDTHTHTLLRRKTSRASEWHESLAGDEHFMESEPAALTLKERCIMGSTWTWAAFQSVVTLRRTCSDSRQHMMLNLSRERHTLDPRTSASATSKADYGLRSV